MKNIHKHLIAEHKLSPFASYLKEIIYGGNDGIVTTFAVVSGFAGASQAGDTSLVLTAVLLFGFANLFADATSMGLGNFLSERSERDVYLAERQKELHEITHEATKEKLETIFILKEKGYSEEDAKKLTELYAKNPAYWVEFMMRFELDMDRGSDHPALNAFATFIAFIVFGAIPLIPYVFLSQYTDHLFLLSCVSAGSALLILGILRWLVTRISLVRSLAEAFLIGSLASMVAYGVGMLFG